MEKRTIDANGFVTRFFITVFAPFFLPMPAAATKIRNARGNPYFPREHRLRINGPTKQKKAQKLQEEGEK